MNFYTEYEMYKSHKFPTFFMMTFPLTWKKFHLQNKVFFQEIRKKNMNKNILQICEQKIFTSFFINYYFIYLKTCKVSSWW